MNSLDLIFEEVLGLEIILLATLNDLLIFILKIASWIKILLNILDGSMILETLKSRTIVW